MALVMFGFMWLSKPDVETARPDSHVVENAAADAAAADGATAAAMPAEAGIAAAVTAAAHGTLPATYTDSYFALAVDTLGRLSGTYTNGTDTVPVADLIAGTSALDPASKALAAQRASALVANAGRYGGFAAFMGGADVPTVLENDVVRVPSAPPAPWSRKWCSKNTPRRWPATQPTSSSSTATPTATASDSAPPTSASTPRSLTFRSRAEGDSAVYYYVAPADGAEWGIRYTLLPGSHVLRTEIVQKGMAAVLPASTSSMGFDWRQMMARNELGRTFEERNSAIYYKYIGEGVDDLSANGDDSESLNGRLRWVAFKNQFFSSVVIARDCFNAADLKSVEIKNDRYLKDMSMAATLPYTPADGTAAAFDFYFGPNDYPLLSSLDDTLDVGEDLSLTRLIPLGWGLFRWINTLIVIPVFSFLGSFISNYGIIILLLTIFIKLIIFPFTYKSFMSQAKMRVLAPEIKAINDKYPDAEDAMKRQQETMALYSRAGASPFSGCLPHAAADARAHRHVLLLPLGHRAPRTGFPLGTRPLRTRRSPHPAVQHSLLRQPCEPLLPPHDGNPHHLHARKHAVAASVGLHARHEDDAVPHARHVPLHLQRLCLGPELLLPPSRSSSPSSGPTSSARWSMRRRCASSSSPTPASPARRAAGWLASKKRSARHRPHSASSRTTPNAADNPQHTAGRGQSPARFIPPENLSIPHP